MSSGLGRAQHDYRLFHPFLIVAATAELAGITVWCDKDFEIIAQIRPIERRATP